MKIPVGKTLEAAFTFVFKNFLSVVGIFWFPMLVGLVLIGGVLVRIVIGIHHFPDPTTDPQTFTRLVVEFIAFDVWLLVVILVTGAMIQVGLLRKALGLHPSPVFIFYSLGSDVWRMIGATFLLIVIVIAVELGLFAANGLLYWLLNAMAGKALAVIAVVVTGIASFCFYVYVAVRLGYFLPAVVVAEHRIGLGRSWELARGNVWRILALVVVIVIAVFFVFGTLQSLFAPPFIMDFTSAHTDPHEVLRSLVVYLRSAGPVLAIVDILQMLFIYGLMAGAVANAYRAVTQTPPLSQGTQIV